MTTNTTPLEDAEQTDFVKWLEINDLKFTAIPNNTYTKYMSQKVKNHRVGLRPGFPDMVVLVPPDRSLDGEGYFLVPEMKRIKGSTTSEEQKAWIEAINNLGVLNITAMVCKGSEAAKSFVKHYLKEPIDDIF